jgi:cytochrome b561
MTFNSTTRWGWPAKMLHWLSALIILLLLGHGWWMTHMTPRPERLANYAGHSALGYDFMVRLAAHVGHASLYLLMFVVSLTGWMVATTFRTPMTKDVFGINIPAIVTTVERPVRQWIEESHMVLAYVLAVVVVVHIIGAFRHHIFKKNDVLRRMTWGMRT